MTINGRMTSFTIITDAILSPLSCVCVCACAQPQKELLKHTSSSSFQLIYGTHLSIQFMHCADCCVDLTELHFKTQEEDKHLDSVLEELDAMVSVL